MIDDIIRMLISLNSQLEKSAVILKAFLGFDCRKWTKLQKVNMNFSQLFEETTYITYVPQGLYGGKQDCHDRGLDFSK